MSILKVSRSKRLGDTEIYIESERHGIGIDTGIKRGISGVKARLKFVIWYW